VEKLAIFLEEMNIKNVAALLILLSAGVSSLTVIVFCSVTLLDGKATDAHWAMLSGQLGIWTGMAMSLMKDIWEKKQEAIV
jgi:hypothetical protein